MNAASAPLESSPQKSWWQRPWVWVCVAILALAMLVLVTLVGIVMFRRPVYGSAGQATAVAQMNNLTVALMSYRATCGAFPTEEQGLQTLAVKPTIPPIPAKWTPLIQTLPKDPWNHPYGYRNPSPSDPNKIEIFSLGPTGMPGGDQITVSFP